MRAKKVAEECVELFTETVMVDVNESVTRVYENQRSIEADILALQEQSAQFVRETNKWITMYSKFNKAMKVFSRLQYHCISFTTFPCCSKVCVSEMENNPHQIETTKYDFKIINNIFFLI